MRIVTNLFDHFLGDETLNTRDRGQVRYNVCPVGRTFRYLGWTVLDLTIDFSARAPQDLLPNLHALLLPFGLDGGYLGSQLSSYATQFVEDVRGGPVDPCSLAS